MKKIVVLALSLLLLAAAFATTSCSTAEGFGRDMQYLGRAIEDAAG